MHYNKNMSLPLVSIITTSYNSFDFLEETLKSVLCQDYPKIEYIFSDDGSTNFDLFKDKIFKIIDENKKSNLENVAVLHNRNNVGTVKNLNNALSRCRGEYVIHISLDDVFIENCTVSKIISSALNSKSDILSFGRIEVDENGQKGRHIPPRFFYKKIKKLNTSKKQYISLITNHFYEMASGSAICVKREFLDKIGQYDIKYKLWEDGPLFVNCFKANSIIKTDYSIDGIYYRLTGISNSKNNSAAGVRFNEDTYNFYCSNLNEGTFRLKRIERKMLEYTIAKESKARRESVIFYIKYLDVVIINQFVKLENMIALFDEKYHL